MGDLSWDLMENAKPKIFKIFDNFNNNENAAKIKQISPETTIIGRIYNANQPQNGDPTKAAQDWWNQNQAIILANPSIDYWEGYNEPNCGYNSMEWITNMEIARMNILTSNGLKACIYNVGVGSPDVTNSTIIQMMYPALKEAMNQSAILGLHEYSAPWMSSDFDNNTQNGWLTGRYRKLYNEYLIPNGYGNIPLAITEMGIDSGCPSNICTSCVGGWQSFTNYWCQNGGSCNGSWEYMWQLEWYDNLMRNDIYVLGATIFCLEIPGWDTFQLTKPVIDDMIAYMNSLDK